MSAGKDLMTLAQWGRRLGISPATAWRRFRDGEIETVNVGSPGKPKLRVTEEAHARYLAARVIRARRAA